MSLTVSQHSSPARSASGILQRRNCSPVCQIQLTAAALVAVELQTGSCQRHSQPAVPQASSLLYIIVLFALVLKMLWCRREPPTVLSTHVVGKCRAGGSPPAIWGPATSNGISGAGISYRLPGVASHTAASNTCCAGNRLLHPMAHLFVAPHGSTCSICIQQLAVA